MNQIWTESHYGRLRLRWNYQGKRKTLTLGVDNNSTGWAFAKQKAAQIELDLVSGNYDPSLLKYKPRSLGKAKTELTVVELFEAYSGAMKRDKSSSPNGLQKCKALKSHLERFFGDTKAVSVSDRRAGNFVAELLEYITRGTIKQDLSPYAIWSLD